MTVARLYDIAEEYRFLLNDMVDQETGVIDEMALERLSNLKDPLENKCINITRIFEALETESDAIEQKRKEINARMMAREKALKNQILRLKSYLLENMEKCEISKIECPQFVIGIQKNPPSVDIFDESLIPSEYDRIKIDKDLARIRDDLKNGVVIPGARLVQGKSIRIR